MASVSEVWIVEGLETTTRRQQKSRLSEWKKLFLAEGAKSVAVWEGGYGEYNGAWIFTVEFDSAAAWGQMMDKYTIDSTNIDNAMEAWQKTPVLKFRGGGLLHLATDI